MAETVEKASVAHHAHQPDNDALIDPQLLQMLLDTRHAMTVESLALQRGCEQAAVLRELRRLREAGCTFHEHPQHGVRLAQTGVETWMDYLRYSLGSHRLIEVYRCTASTQDACRRLLTSHGLESEGAVVAAHEQTAGRGRLGRQWQAPPAAALTFSRACSLDSITPATGSNASATVDRITFAASVAVAWAVEQMAFEYADRRIAAQIKWPNDVCLEGRKLAGILVETCSLENGIRAAVLGVGLNVGHWPREEAARDPALAARLTTLAAQGAGADRLRALVCTVKAIDSALQCDQATLLAHWRQRCMQFDQPIRVRCQGRMIEGWVVDLDPYEGLIVRSHLGEIVHLPAATTTVI